MHDDVKDDDDNNDTVTSLLLMNTTTNTSAVRRKLDNLVKLADIIRKNNYIGIWKSKHILKLYNVYINKL